MRDDLIEIAKVKGPKGLKGEFLLTPYGDSFEQFKAYPYLIIGSLGKPRRVLSCMQRKGKYIVRLEGITNISQAERLKGEGVFIKRQWLPHLEEDEYYWRDLIGMKVLKEDGRELGELVNIIRTGSNDVYVVDKEKQYLIPAVVDVVKDISIEKRTIVVDTSSLDEILE
ncbi:MAG: ribosome maturation factor RimM [Thermodesulfobacteriota bacterium]|nr:ribosome maturation factor RimM [Thermodesulfobacteriota bacterium]